MGNQNGHSKIAAAEAQLREFESSSKHLGRWLSKLEFDGSLTIQVGNAGMVSIERPSKELPHSVRWSLCAPPRYDHAGERHEVDAFDRVKGLEVARKTTAVPVSYGALLTVLTAIYHGTQGGEYDHYRAMYQVTLALAPDARAPDSLLQYLERYVPQEDDTERLTLTRVALPKPHARTRRLPASLR